jgi:translation initiation factor IF-1
MAMMLLTSWLAVPIAAQEAVLETIAVTTLRMPGPDPIKTTARLTLLPDTRWHAALADESFILTLDAGLFRISLEDGRARIARAPGSIFSGRTLVEIVPGDVATLRPGDRLISHDSGSVWVQNVGEIGAAATVIRVRVPVGT